MCLYETCSQFKMVFGCVNSCEGGDTTITKSTKVSFESELHEFYIIFPGKMKTLLLLADKRYMQESLPRAAICKALCRC